MKSSYFKYIPILLLIVSAFGCSKDAITDSNFELGFSLDTLKFDTVFVTLGSTTKSFTVRNEEDGPVVISSIQLMGGFNSSYRINVNGDALPSGIIRDITIPPKDSIYVFVEVTIDPNGNQLPFLIEDRVRFTTNGNEQDVILRAYGQNANFYDGEEIGTMTWTDELPYVILGSILIKECETLTIREGVDVFFGGNSGMFVAGNLVVEGQRDSTVTFRGVRLDELTDELEYDDVPGQWLGIFLLRNDGCSVESSIEHADIRNAQFGLSLGSTALEEFPTSTIENGPVLHIENSIVRNHSVFGIFGLLSTITGDNLLVHAAGSQLLAFQMGGNYQFTNSTFHNRGSAFLDHQDELLFFSNYFFDPTNAILEERDLEALNFTNCILYGSLQDEIVGDTLDEVNTDFNFFFDHCLLKTREELTGHVNEVIFNADPLFVDLAEGDFQLAEGSPCIDQGDGFSSGTEDLNGSIRDASPDIGAFEFAP